ncbi:MAG: homoserine kinase [Burkholderiaceae bacterium]|nr:homoserine kinase [Burkholderiaceae bacterium]
MAVFTPVSEGSLQVLLNRFDLGQLVGFEGIASGIENTNYFVDTTSGRFVLTLFEKLTAEQLPFYLGLMRHLADRGVACPRPMADRSGSILHTCEAKPASLATRLKGQWQPDPTPAHCRILGAAIAASHLAVMDYQGSQPNLRGLSWWQQTVPQILPFLNSDQANLLKNELKAQTDFMATAAAKHLPRGAVHADIFRDNVLFEETAAGPELGGFIDFYFAGVDHFVFDLAVAVNDWCITHDAQDRGELLTEHRDALLSGYESIRPLSDVERDAWPMMLRAAAYRFWVSRLYDWYLPRNATMLTPKDPGHFERLLRTRQS